MTMSHTVLQQIGTANGPSWHDDAIVLICPVPGVEYWICAEDSDEGMLDGVVAENPCELVGGSSVKKLRRLK